MKRSVELEVHLFGPLRLHINGVEVDTQRWKSKKALTLFKILAEGCGNRFPKDVLIDAMWNDEGDFERSSHNLHTVVYYLRRELEPDLKRYARPRLVRHAAGLYWLEPSPEVRVDVVKFRRLVREAETLRTRDALASLDTYKRALALYTDDFLPENLYCDWAADPREALREQFFAAASAVAELTLQLHAPRTAAINLCRRALQRDSLREELHRALIHLLSAEGLFAEAAEQYRQCERLLQKEFRVHPSPETRAAYERLMAGAAGDGGISISQRAEGPPGPEYRQGAISDLSEIPGSPNASSAHAPAAQDPAAANAPGTPALPGGPGQFEMPSVATDGPTMCGRETYLFLHRLELSRQVHTGLPMALLRIGFPVPDRRADFDRRAGFDGREAGLSGRRQPAGQPDQRGQPDQPDQRGQPDQPDQRGQPDQRDQRDQPDQPGRPDRSEPTELSACIDVVRHVLRTGDVFCWESPGRLLIQLPATDDDGVRLVKARLQHGLEQAGFVFFDIRYTVIDGNRSHIAAAAESVEQGSAS